MIGVTAADQLNSCDKIVRSKNAVDDNESSTVFSKYL